MPKSVTIKLRNPIVGHGGQVTELIVKEPGCADLLELGEPYSLVRTPKEGAMLYNEFPEVIKAYFARCVSTPKADALLIESQLSLVDTLAAKEGLLGFFIAARRELFGAPSESSSSTSSGSAPATSGA